MGGALSSCGRFNEDKSIFNNKCSMFVLVLFGDCTREGGEFVSHPRNNIAASYVLKQWTMAHGKK
eukprot:2753023-Ditylum_brightwellii.AAC.1